MLLKFMFLTDPHGELMDKDAFNVAMKFTGLFRPHVKVLGGDLFDFAAFRLNAGAHEKSLSIKKDVHAGMEFLKRWEPNVFLRGNHDERCWDVAQNEVKEGPRRDMAIETVEKVENWCKANKCEILPYNLDGGFYDLGDITFAHGFNSGVDAATKTLKDLGFKCFIMGHTHAPRTISLPGVKSPRLAVTSGCLCKLNMTYSRSHVGRQAHQHGFVYGFVDEKTGHYEVYSAVKGNLGWILPDDFKRYC
jgi:hypothetical protein